MNYNNKTPMISGGLKNYILYSTVCHGYGYGGVTHWGVIA